MCPAREAQRRPAARARQGVLSHICIRSRRHPFPGQLRRDGPRPGAWRERGASPEGVAPGAQRSRAGASYWQQCAPARRRAHGRADAGAADGVDGPHLSESRRVCAGLDADKANEMALALADARCRGCAGELGLRPGGDSAAPLQAARGSPLGGSQLRYTRLYAALCERGRGAGVSFGSRGVICAVANARGHSTALAGAPRRPRARKLRLTSHPAPAAGPAWLVRTNPSSQHGPGCSSRGSAARAPRPRPRLLKRPEGDADPFCAAAVGHSVGAASCAAGPGAGGAGGGRGLGQGRRVGRG
jgi:hypothetical protein